jgi:hypothetical protein
MTVLLTVMLVMDDSSHHRTKALTQTLKSRFSACESWEGNYEILDVTVSDGILEETAGKVSTISALMVNNDYLTNCSGKYVWILPSFIEVDNNPDLFIALFGALSMGVDAVVIENFQNDIVQKKVELSNSVMDSLPVLQLFDEFRYIIRQDYLMKCFLKDADFHTIPAYLSFNESQKALGLYAIIPLNLTVTRGVTSHALFLLCMSFFSETRAWQRETLILPTCLLYQKDLTNILHKRHSAIVHFMFSSCSALEEFSKIIFNQRSQGLVKDEFFSIVKQIIVYLECVSNQLEYSNILLSKIAKISYFINYWEQIWELPFALENITNIEAEKRIFDGIWWLGKELKDDFNQLGKQRFIDIINEFRESIEQGQLIYLANIHS